MKLKTALSKVSSKGFTLIELLIVIAILGILAGGLLVAIDPVDKTNAANDARVQSNIDSISRAAESYAVQRNGFFPAATTDLTTSGELRAVPTAPGGYSAYVYTPTPAGCTAGTTCTSFIVTGQLKSKRFVNATPSTPVWRYESTSGKSCAVATVTTACP